MKLTKESIKHNASWKGYRLPQYDIDTVRENTQKAPTWLHFGAGNLFRAFPAVLAQRMLTAGLSDTGVICCDGYDEELIERCYRACDHLSLVVTLYSNGTINKEVVASVTESLKMSEDMARLQEIFLAPSLQMVSFTLTEKGYVFQNDAHMRLSRTMHTTRRTVRKAALLSSASWRRSAWRAAARDCRRSRWFRWITARITACVWSVRCVIWHRHGRKRASSRKMNISTCSRKTRIRCP